MSQQLKAHFPIFALVPFQIQLSWQHLSSSAPCHPREAQGLIYFSSLISDASFCILLPVLSLSFHPGNGDQVHSHHSLHCAAHSAFQSTFILTISLDCVRQLSASMPCDSQGLACSVTYPGDDKASYSVLTASSISPHASVFTPVFLCPLL